jgi:SPX domain protein involved in polyphosphate accumulation
MSKKIQNLVVDYEDQADWLQDSIVLEDVILDGNHDALITKLEYAVYDMTRDNYNPPSKHIRIMGYAPADSDVTVKRGLNFWVHPENIFAQEQ